MSTLGGLLPLPRAENQSAGQVVMLIWRFYAGGRRLAGVFSVCLNNKCSSNRHAQQRDLFSLVVTFIFGAIYKALTLRCFYRRR